MSADPYVPTQEDRLKKRVAAPSVGFQLASCNVGGQLLGAGPLDEVGGHLLEAKPVGLACPAEQAR